MSLHAPQFARLHSLHSDIRKVNAEIHSHIKSIDSIDNSTEYMSKRSQLKTAFTLLESTVDTYGTSLGRLKRQISKMVADTAEKTEEKKKEEELFNELKDTVEEEIDYDEVFLKDLVSSLDARIKRVLSNADSDIISIERITATREAVHASLSISHTSVAPQKPTSTQAFPSAQNSTGTDSQHQNPISPSETQNNQSSQPSFQIQNDQMSTALSTLFERMSAPPLPPITLIPFDGESTQWESFYSQYMSEIDSKSHISDHSKLLYLRGALTGSALLSVEGIPVEGRNLQPTIDRLKSVYGRSKRSNTILINQLFSIRPKSSSFEDQLECTQQLINKIHQLEDQSMVDNFALINQIAGTIHSKHLKSMYRLEPSTMKEALFHIENDLRERIEIMKLESTFRSTNRYGIQQNPRERNPYPEADEERSEISKPKQPHNGPACVYCGSHAFSICPTITSISERKAILRDKNLCFNCLSSKHTSNQCDRKCQQCSKPHHLSICDSTSSPSNPNPSTLTATVTSVDSVHAMPRLYTTDAVLQNPLTNRTTTKQVLLDNGSMVSLISRKLTHELNLKPHSSVPMTLRGVGGKPTGGTTHDVVTVNVLTTKGLLPIDAVVLDTTITHPMYHNPLSKDDYSIIQSNYGDYPHLTQPSTITPDLLISIGGTQSILNDSKVTNLPSGYTLIHSSLGPIIIGQTHSNKILRSKNNKNHVLMTSVIAEYKDQSSFHRLNSTTSLLPIDKTNRDTSSFKPEQNLNPLPHIPPLQFHPCLITNSDSIADDSIPHTVIHNPNSHNQEVHGTIPIIQPTSIMGTTPRKKWYSIPFKFDGQYDPGTNPARIHSLPRSMMTRPKSRRQAGGNLTTSMST